MNYYICLTSGVWFVFKNDQMIREFPERENVQEFMKLNYNPGDSVFVDQ